MFGIGAQEMIVILVVALLVFGPKRLPELARTVGRGLAEFRRASTDMRRAFDMNEEPHRIEPPPQPAQAGLQKPEPEAPESGHEDMADEELEADGRTPKATAHAEADTTAEAKPAESAPSGPAQTETASADTAHTDLATEDDAPADDGIQPVPTNPRATAQTAAAKDRSDPSGAG